MDVPPVAAFYLLQGALLALLWVAVFVGSGVDFLRLSEGLSNTALRPSWLPRRTFLFLVSRRLYRFAAYGTIPALLTTGLVEWHGAVVVAGQECSWWVVGPTPLVVRYTLRLCSAALVTLFQLGDSCRTSSHRDYLMIYVCWALVACPAFCVDGDRVARALSLGLCAFYVLGSGFSKAMIGGFAEWGFRPRTMRAILSTFLRKTPKQGGPVVPAFARLFKESDALCLLGSASTLCFECFVAPSVALFAPTHWRLYVVGGGMLLLHIGIAAVQSGAIGAFFLPNVAVYVFALGNFGDADSFLVCPIFPRLAPGPAKYWYIAAFACFGPLLAGLLRRTRLMPEDWPFTPFALFPWNGAQWERLHSGLVEGDMRLVAVGRVHPGSGQGSACEASVADFDFRGVRVVPLEHRSDVPLMERRVAPDAGVGERLVLYDLFSRTLGITTFQDCILLAAFPVNAVSEEPLACPLAEQLEVMQRRLLDSTGSFLRETGRLVELSSGQVLDRCLLVRAGSDSRVVDVVGEAR